MVRIRTISKPFLDQVQIKSTMSIIQIEPTRLIPLMINILQELNNQ